MGAVTISTPTRLTACSISDDVISSSFFDSSSTILSRKKNLITFRMVPNKIRDRKAVTPRLSFNCSRKFFPIPSKVPSSWNFHKTPPIRVDWIYSRANRSFHTGSFFYGATGVEHLDCVNSSGFVFRMVCRIWYYLWVDCLYNQDLQ